MVQIITVSVKTRIIQVFYILCRYISSSTYYFDFSEKYAGVFFLALYYQKRGSFNCKMFYLKDKKKTPTNSNIKLKKRLLFFFMHKWNVFFFFSRSTMLSFTLMPNVKSNIFLFFDENCNQMEIKLWHVQFCKTMLLPVITYQFN